jgi:hypothetical protein
MSETACWIFWGTTGTWSAARDTTNGRYVAGPVASFAVLTDWINRFEGGEPFELRQAPAHDIQSSTCVVCREFFPADALTTGPCPGPFCTNCRPGSMTLKEAAEAYARDELSVDEAAQAAGVTKVEFLQRAGEFGVSVLREDFGDDPEEPAPPSEKA